MSTSREGGRMRTDSISIIVPFLNEHDCIGEFCSVMDKYAETSEFEIELVFVDDGSTDDTGEVIRGTEFANISKVQLVTFSKNFGSHSAIRAGIAQATCDICTWMGCDLQEPIEFLELSYKKIKDGMDAVYIEKNSVEVSAANRAFSKTYSHLMRKYAISNYGSGGISTIVFDRKIMDYINNNPESNSSIMLQIMDTGFNYCTISLDYGSRFAGKSKWTLKKKIKLFIDSFVSFSFMPIRLVSVIGIILFFIGLAIAIYSIINKIINPDVPMGYSTLMSIMALGFGVTNISLGIIAEYLWRAYDAARKRPSYIISDTTFIKDDRKD